jgi:excisionase family DNA binding protein
MYPLNEAAELLGVGETEMKRLIRSGQLPTVTVGTGTVRRKRLVPAADLKAFVERLRKANARKANAS